MSQNSGLAEVIDRVQVLVKDHQLNRFSFEGDGTRVRITDRSIGSVKWIDKPVTVSRTVFGVADLVRFAKNWGGVPGESIGEIWVSRDSVLLKIEQHHTVKLPLAISSIYAAIHDLDDEEPKALIKKLRLGVIGAGAKINVQDFIASLSQVKFETNQTSESVTRKGDESISRSLQAKVTAAKELPDEVAFTFPLYPSLDMETNVMIHCAVISQPSEGTISVVPYPGEFESETLRIGRVIAESIEDRLSKEEVDIPVYCGIAHS